MEITQEDLRLILHNSIYPLQSKIEVYDDQNNVMDVIYGLISGGSSTSNPESNVRKTLSISIKPSIRNKTLTISEDGLIWVNRHIKFYIGVLNQRTNDYVYYKQGSYYFTQTSATYDATTNTLTINCGDFAVALDGSKNGRIGGMLNYVLYAYDEVFMQLWLDEAQTAGVDITKKDKVFEWAATNHPNAITTSTNADVKTAVWQLMKANSLTQEQHDTYVQTVNSAYPKEVNFIVVENSRMLISYNILRDTLLQFLQNEANITDYIVDEIGEVDGIAEHNSEYLSYREENPLWNTIPYDLEFGAGCTVLDVLIAFRDLYPNYEFFFDENNTFVFRLIPTSYYDEITYDNDFLQQALISENTDLDMTAVKNICEVWGQSFDVDFYTEQCTYADNIYTATVAGYDKYYNGDTVAIKIPSINEEGAKIRIKVGSKTLETINIYNGYEIIPIPAGKLEPGVHVFKIYKSYNNNKTFTKAMYLGQWQPHALDVLVDGSESDETYTDQDGNVYVKYSEGYFKAKYNCEVVNLTINPDSPFTVQKIGEILDVKQGGEYDNITSNSQALLYARTENHKNSVLTDTITLSLKLIPFLEPNKKVSYRKSNLTEEEQFIIKNISHDFDNWTSSITMYRLYPTYEDLIKSRGTYGVLAGYLYGILGKYPNDDLDTFIPGYKY